MLVLIIYMVVISKCLLATSMSNTPLPHAPRVEVLVKRRSEKVVLSRAEREGVKARDIMSRYPAEKAQTLIKNLKDKGLWYYDPEFPKDDEDRSLGFGIMAITITIINHHSSSLIVIGRHYQNHNHYHYRR